MHPNTFGQLLKTLRCQAGLSQVEIGRATGYSKAMISRLESDKRLPALEAVWRVFIPALGVEKNDQVIRQLIELAAIAHLHRLLSTSPFRAQSENGLLHGLLLADTTLVRYVITITSHPAHSAGANGMPFQKI